MKKNVTILAFCGLMAASASAQVQPATVPDIPIWSTIENTGLAIAPYYNWNAVVFDDMSGNYVVQWHDPASGLLLHQTMQQGINPDIAYNANRDNVNVSYDLTGMVWVDDYNYTATPLYTLGANNPIAPGFNSNIDMNSLGQGILTWEDGATVWMCSFTSAPFAAGPPVPVGPGAHPDIALCDDGITIVLTYQQGGILVVDTYDYPSLTGGTIMPIAPPTMLPPGGLGYSYPRVQANRNSMFGPPDLYTIVAQDNMGGGLFDVWSYFFVGPGTPVNTDLTNIAVNMCAPSFPLPVVAYDRDQVHVAFAQNYTCSGIPSPPIRRDVLMKEYDYFGTPIFGPTVYREVNSSMLNFTFSSTSLNTEYDGDYMVTSANYCEGVCFNDPAYLIWKFRDQGVPVFRTTQDNFTVSIDKGVTSNLINVEVSSLDETITEEDVEMDFALYDQSGRLIEIPTFERNGMTFQIDATSLEQGIYLLQYTLNGETKAERIPHFTN